MATSRADYTASEAIRLYGKRLSFEETFRNQKAARFGFGHVQTSIGNRACREKPLPIATLAQAHQTLLGGAAEHAKLGRLMKANARKK